MSKLLIIDGSIENQNAVSLAMGTQHECIMLKDSLHIEETIERIKPDLILLNVNLPHRDGFQTCALLQNSLGNCDIPLILCSERADLESKILGLSVGADDYITKPFEARELKARIECKIRKSKAKVERESVFSAGPLKLNLLSQRAILISDREELILELTPHEFKLLMHLVRHDGQIFSRDQLLDLIWGIDITVSDRMIDTNISHLRKKLGGASSLIKTVVGLGYRYESANNQKKIA